MARARAGGRTLYNHHWGTSERLRGLHFETCYYAAIEYRIAQGLARFEAGAQGRHKLARERAAVAPRVPGNAPAPCTVQEAPERRVIDDVRTAA